MQNSTILLSLNTTTVKINFLIGLKKSRRLAGLFYYGFHFLNTTRLPHALWEIYRTASRIIEVRTFFLWKVFCSHENHAFAIKR